MPLAVVTRWFVAAAVLLGSAVLLGIAGPPSVRGQEHSATEQVELDEMWKVVEVFSRLDRTSSTPGEWEAARYLAGRLESLGIEHWLHEVDSYLSLPVSASLEVLAAEPFQVPVLVPAFSTSARGLRGTLAAVCPQGSGGGAPSPGQPGLVTCRAEDFSEEALSGRIALIRGYPSPALIVEAERAGAIAAVCIAPNPRLVNMIVSSVWGNPGSADRARHPKIPIVSTTEQDGRRLERLATAGRTEVRLSAVTDTGWKKIPLLVAEIRPAVSGADTEGEQFALVANHLDSWYEGVTDSATGDGALLELARVFHLRRGELRRSVRLAWWPGHSTGRYSGSTWYADNFFHELHENAVVYMAFDSPGVRSATELEPEGMFETRRYQAKVLREYTGKDFSPIRSMRYNDEALWGIGVPSLTVYPAIPMGHPDRAKDAGGSAYGYWWHTDEDSLDKADPELLLHDTRLYLALLWPLLTEERLPFDFAPVTEQMRGRLRELQSAAGSGWDFGPTLELVADLAAALPNLDRMSTSRRNRALMELSRLINPVLYTRAGPFRHDPARQFPLFPGLADAEQLRDAQQAGDLETGYLETGYLETALRRESNRVEHALRLAIDRLDEP